MRAKWLCSILVIFAVACASHPDELAYEDLRTDLLHSDLPLFTDSENMWPQHFADDGSFGCVTRVAVGDWAFREKNSEEIVWYRIDNYGVFHCWALLGSSHERAELEAAEATPTFFVFLGEEAGQELWVAQIGVVPGSEYVLLARSPADGTIDAFDVLQRRCPSQDMRNAGPIDILFTQYCAVNNRTDLLRLARQMVHLPPVGTLSLAPSKTKKAQ